MGEMMIASRTVAATVALLMAGALPTAAQQTPTAPAQQAEMSDAMVTKVGTAMRHVAKIREQYSQRAQGAKSPQQQQALSDEARDKMLTAISDEGLSLQQYNSAIQMAQNNQTLTQRLLSAVQSGD
jgi:hypothetical protein